ncbi:MAG: AI-2E family transporter [Pseudomonadales bacterium]|nr:AI-2E family transporter [Pseudomonadales bacterium]
MLTFVKNWYQRYFSDNEAIVLFILLVSSFVIIMTMGQVLTPVFAAIILAYLMQGMVNGLRKKNIGELPAILFVYTIFIGFLGSFLFILMPLTWIQLTSMLDEQLPRIIAEGQRLIEVLPARYPELVTELQAREWIELIRSGLGQMGQTILSFSFSNLPNLMAFLIFLVLVPVLVFFFLKDKQLLVDSFVSLLPESRPVMNKVWEEMNEQISNYVRGKVIEIIIVGGTTYIALVILGVKYPALLGLLVGLSVVIPYIGAAMVTIPVALMGYFQFGMESQFLTLMVVYGIIQALDGNVLVPLLFSEAVKIHPVAIIVSVLIFGGLWGMWGVFFAIPLATLVKAVFTAWPSKTHAIVEMAGE